MSSLAKMSKEQFKLLQKEWYAKLKDAGFADIEIMIDGEMQILNRTYSLLRRGKDFNLTKEYTDEHFSYFNSIAEKATDQDIWFRSDIDRYIMQRHSEGAKIKDICLELKTFSKGKDRYSVRIIIRRYEMLWGIKSYTPRQLHRKEV